MFHRLVTKSGDEIWYPSYAPIAGRHEVARLTFASWERQKKREELNPNLSKERQ